MLIINFEGREVKGLSKGRYDETFADEDGTSHALAQMLSGNYLYWRYIWSELDKNCLTL